MNIGKFEVSWLNGGEFRLDGGAMFGVVPKALWEKKYFPVCENLVPLRANPLLINTSSELILVESGLGNKLTEKQLRIFQVQCDWNIKNDLKSIGFRVEDISAVILTHFDFDHSGGVVFRENNGELALTFPNARHILQKREWYDVLHANHRSVNTYWPINFEILRDSDKLELINGDTELFPGIELFHTGGHNGGHQIVRIQSGVDVALHLGDLLPTHAHFNPLWVMAYDNFPLEAIAQKEKWISRGLEDKAWFTFYHDAIVLAAKFDDHGNILERIS